MWHLSFFVALTIFFSEIHFKPSNKYFILWISVRVTAESGFGHPILRLSIFLSRCSESPSGRRRVLSPGFAGYVFWFQFPQFQAGEYPVVPARLTGQFYLLFSFFNIWFELDVKEKYFRKKFTNDLEIYFKINHYRLVFGKVINRTKMAWISRTLFGQDKVMCLPKEFRKNSIWQWDF